MSKQYTEYQGVAVADIQSEVKYRHPKWGYDEDKMPTMDKASLLLLADSTLIVVCDEDGCGFNGLTGRAPYVKPQGEYKTVLSKADSVLAHKSSMHWRTPGRPPIYTEEDIKAVIKIWLKWKSTKIRGWGKAAAADMNRIGMKPAHAASWTSSSMGSIVRNNIHRDEFKNLRAAPMSDDDRILARMIRNATDQGGGPTTVANNARVTERKRGTPIDLAAIIASKETPTPLQPQKEEQPVTTAKPTLSFASLDRETAPPAFVIESVAVPAATVPAPAQQQTVPLVSSSDSSYQHLAVMPDGSPVFVYNGSLMVGKIVKGIQV